MILVHNECPNLIQLLKLCSQKFQQLNALRRSLLLIAMQRLLYNMYNYIYVYLLFGCYRSLLFMSIAEG